MSSCDIVKSKNIICQETFKFEHEDKDIKIYKDFGRFAVVNGNAKIIPLKCCIVNPPKSKNIKVDVEFVIKENLTISELGNEDIHREFVFRIAKRFTFKDCKINDTSNLKCEVVCISGENDIRLNSNNNTLTQKIKACLEINIFKERRIIFDLSCPKFPSDC
ncbi:hypothetical protein [Tepidibacter formicigenes]|uniref:SipL SPOCS domain-containing protein n=1 Tax=Tepidibacter formicigenes DSM 15518 TaxID=1123349 RepID=A0A1M6K664_9FIRM|nr:hypothetical protein [Tepidibacter formicigenes]SHJ54438.1 hypothetical protein SAMN02744037_00303 [Tepidibacter formicigenes DSM 15518]